MILHTEIIGLPIGVNVPGWEKRAETLLQYYAEGKIGALQYYAAPRFDKSFKVSNLKRLSNMLKAVYSISNPLEIVVHMAHDVHGFNPALGLTRNNMSCINAASEALAILGSTKVVFHPGSYKGKQTKQMYANISKVFEVITKRCEPAKALVENMPATNSDIVLLYTGNNPVETESIEKMRQEHCIGLCLDYTHAAVAATKLASELFPAHYAETIECFISKSPEVLHVTGSRLGDTTDMSQPLTYFNIPQICHAAAYSLRKLKEHKYVPVILELPVSEWNEEADLHNLGIAYAGVALASMRPEMHIKASLERHVARLIEGR